MKWNRGRGSEGVRGSKKRPEGRGMGKKREKAVLMTKVKREEKIRMGAKRKVEKKEK